MAQSIHRSPARDETPHCKGQPLRIVSTLAERFGLARSDISQLLNKDRDFFQLVEEYEACSDAVDRLEDQDIDRELRNHYADVLSQVENEMMDYLAACGRRLHEGSHP